MSPGPSSMQPPVRPWSASGISRPPSEGRALPPAPWTGDRLGSSFCSGGAGAVREVTGAWPWGLPLPQSHPRGLLEDARACPCAPGVSLGPEPTATCPALWAPVGRREASGGASSGQGGCRSQATWNSCLGRLPGSGWAQRPLPAYTSALGDGVWQGVGDSPTDSATVQPETLLPLSQPPGPSSPSRPRKGRKAPNPQGPLQARGERGW